jgi:lipopolysaccharide biosynthesis glycosyltransferase
MKQTFVTYLGTDSFLPGLLVLAYSYRSHSAVSPFLVLVNEQVSGWVFDFLKIYGFDYKKVRGIDNPHLLINGDREFHSVYGKLNVFNLICYDKVVYLDADMVICESLQELFQRPHLSAVTAGSLVPCNSSWKDLNSGLMVIQPDKELFEEMLSKVSILPSSTKGDQGFLHSFYPKWSTWKELHLDHKYNIPAQYLDEYASIGFCRFDYEKGIARTDNIAVLHYWGPIKPWQALRYHAGTTQKVIRAFRWWRDLYERLPLSADEKNKIRGLW